MTHNQIRQKFLDFFENKGHKSVPSSSLLPTDPSVLFTTAGVQQFKPYYTGQSDPMKDFGSLNIMSIQKSLRTDDIDEVGDSSHGTFFEMLGIFSFGNYFKKETIQWTYDFVVNILGFDKKRLRPTVFAGDDQAPFDKESFEIWKNLGFSDDQIGQGSRKDNFWGPIGNEGPCGPANELYLDNIEIGTLVFNEYYSDKDKQLKPLIKKGVDVGLGFDRIVMFSQNKFSMYETNLLLPTMSRLPEDLDERAKRIITDHARAISFIVSDGVVPSNKDQGYILRRLIRRIITQAQIHVLGEVSRGGALAHPRISVEIDFGAVFQSICNTYQEFYPELNQQKIVSVFDEEEIKFKKTLKQGLRELEKLESINSQQAFRLYESYGLPFEVIKDAVGDRAKNLTREGFDEEFKKHQEKSRAGAEKKFGGHGLLMDTGLGEGSRAQPGISVELKVGNKEELEKATRLHTATHLLHASLRKVLGKEVKQAGSDITAERLRFDFTFSRKMTLEEIQEVGNLINEAIKKDYKVTKEEMVYEDAIKSGALAFFKLKYPPIVNVFTIGGTDSAEAPFSRELCGGPHISHTTEIGKIKIIKEEAVSAGVRRIRAVLD